MTLTQGPVFPAKAGTQIHPKRLVGFTWAPTFVGETEIKPNARTLGREFRA
jgi:hypothetical protein